MAADVAAWAHGTIGAPDSTGASSIAVALEMRVLKMTICGALSVLTGRTDTNPNGQLALREALCGAYSPGSAITAELISPRAESLVLRAK